MDFLMNLIATPLGWIMYFCYNIVENYGIGLIVFTIITKLILLPLSIKQQKSTVKMAAMRPQMDEINKKYKGNTQKLNEEMQLLYQRENYNPLSGCLPLLIQMPILFGLIDVVYYPMEHILRMPSETIAKATELVNSIPNIDLGSMRSPEMAIIKEVQTNPGAFASMGDDFISQITNFDFTFMGIYLGDTPTIAFNLLLMVPVLSLLTSFLLSFISTKMSTASMGDNAQMKGMTNSMLYTMPIMSAFISISVPAGVGFYWIFSNLFSALQTFVLYKIFNPAEMIAKAKAEAEERVRLEREERKIAKQKVKEGNAEYSEKAMTKGEINSAKLAAARKRMAERYGDDVTTDDN